jgi:hypothetical protein
MDSQQPATVATAEDKPGCASVNGSTYAIVLLETLTIKRLANLDDLRTALNAIGDRPTIVLKWHEGAKRWTQPEIYA